MLLHSDPSSYILDPSTWILGHSSWNLDPSAWYPYPSSWTPDSYFSPFRIPLHETISVLKMRLFYLKLQMLSIVWNVTVWFVIVWCFIDGICEQAISDDKCFVIKWIFLVPAKSYSDTNFDSGYWRVIRTCNFKLWKKKTELNNRLNSSATSNSKSDTVNWTTKRFVPLKWIWASIFGCLDRRSTNWSIEPTGIDIEFHTN